MNDIIICGGFKAAGVSSGIKKNGNYDLGLIFSDRTATVAGIFTRNIIQAAPVIIDRERIQSGSCRAVIVNSGNANCCTGDDGIHAAKAMAQFAANGLGISEDDVLVASTGVIGEPLPVEKIKAAVPGAIKSLKPEGFIDFAKSIMTTDTIPKVISRQGIIGGKTYTITGVAKGAGMIRPDMATMLCFICTDVSASPEFLKETLCKAAERSFNRITIDGDTSTNDTVLIMASGLSGVEVNNESGGESFQQVLDNLLISLAKLLVKDGEGATKFVEILVKGALSDKDARIVADTVSHSYLVKSALFGEDANWGRIIGAVGRSTVFIEPDRIDIFFDDVLMVKNSMGCGVAAEANAAKVLKQPEFTISIDLNLGSGSASIFTCDLSVDYVKINADYRS